MSEDSDRIERAIAMAQVLAEAGAGIVEVYAPRVEGGCTCLKAADCSSPGKHPVGADWQKRATRSPATIEQRVRRRDGQYGVVPARDGGLLILDVDHPERWPAEIELPPTFTVESSPGRLHRYLRLPEGYDPASLPAAMPWGEVRVEGASRHVVGPYSRHPSGGVYTPSGTPAEIAEVDAGLLERLFGARPGTSFTPSADGEWTWSSDHGSRHEHLLRVARRWHGDGLTRLTVRAELDRYIERHAIPLDDGKRVITPAELDEIVRWVFERTAEDEPEAAAGDAWQPLAGDSHHGGRFAAEVRGRVAWDAATKAWYVFRGHHWRRDTRHVVKRMYRDYLAQRMAEAVRISDEDKRRVALQSVMAASRTDARVNGALAMAAVDLAVDPGAWDRDPWLLGVGNGVLDLRTGGLRPGRPEDWITKAVSADYDPTARAPQFARFLEEVFRGDAELIGWLQLFFGYTLTGLSEAETFALCHGRGANGKSTLLKVIAKVMGDYAVTVNTDAILAAQRSSGAGPNEEVADLRGARLAIAIEAERDMVMSDARAKKLASRDRLRASKKHQHDVEWEPSHTLFVSVNELPQVNDSSEGAWRRIALVPFGATFPPGQRDETIGERLVAEEAAGILAWMVEGAMRYAADRSLHPRPLAVAEATERYRASEDHMGRFIDECVRHAPGEQAPAGAAFTTYTEWCNDRRLTRSARWTSQVFGRDFAARVSAALGVEVTKEADRTKRFHYSDIRVSYAPAGSFGLGVQEDAGGRFRNSLREDDIGEFHNSPPASSGSGSVKPVSAPTLALAPASAETVHVEYCENYDNHRNHHRRDGSRWVCGVCES